MNRNEAVTWLREINDVFKEIPVSAVSLNKISEEDYKLRIKGTLDKSIKNQLAEIAKKHGLILEEIRDGFELHRTKTIHV